MGRLPALIPASGTVVLALTLCACDDAKKPNPAPPSNKRNDAVLASPSSSAPRPAPAPSAAASPTKPHALCAGGSLNRAMPTDKLGHAEAPGAPSLGDAIAVGDSRWTWINLWAAWCVPCKQEMPILLRWQAKLGSSMRLVFVSLDDDERQLMKFLESQPATGVRTSHWLPDGNVRENWLGAMKLKSSPQLPVQILVNPAGRVHCIIEGAIEESDFAQVSAIVTGR
ncbi:MAG: TlpA family protein disulfide reductase [Deltaproteobacteria bacterium]|nr:TlpA family protein disulfide reductase [Deltaproteobacteria bacterium]